MIDEVKDNEIFRCFDVKVTRGKKGMNRQRAKKKPRFLTQSPKAFLKQVDDVMADRTLSPEQKVHGLNGILRDSLRTYGFYTDGYRMVSNAVNEALKQCEKCSEVVTDG